MRKTTTVLLTIMGVFVFLADAHADIASKEYVDKMGNTLVFGSTTPNSNDVAAVSNAGGVKGYIDNVRAYAQNVNDGTYTLAFGGTPGTGTVDQDITEVMQAGGLKAYVDTIGNNVSEGATLLQDAVSQQQNVGNAFIKTNSDGDMVTATGGVITNGDISSSANIEMGKMRFPTPGADCETNGCMLMYYDGKYVWEVVTRETGESISTTGYVSSVAIQNSVSTNAVADITEHPCGPNAYWDTNDQRCKNSLLM